MGWMDGDIVDEECFVGHSEDKYSGDDAAAFGDDHLLGTDDFRVVVGHRARKSPDAVDVMLVRGVDELRNGWCVGCAGRSEHVSCRLVRHGGSPGRVTKGRGSPATCRSRQKLPP